MVRDGAEGGSLAATVNSLVAMVSWYYSYVSQSSLSHGSVSRLSESRPSEAVRLVSLVRLISLKSLLIIKEVKGVGECPKVGQALTRQIEVGRYYM
jgi:archaellum biogenesis protein FlaJ (TadC family)